MHKGKLTNINPPRITTEPSGGAVQFENLGQSEKLFRLQKKVDKSCFHALHVLNPFVYQCFGVKGDR